MKKESKGPKQVNLKDRKGCGRIYGFLKDLALDIYDPCRNMTPEQRKAAEERSRQNFRGMHWG